MNKVPKVSVVMITYGHENYIRQAIEGVLMQECGFEVELILANDCSTDQTNYIIQNILENHPRKSWVKYFKHEKNIGMMSNFIFAMKQCQGKYIALCEGDDYWTNSLKLQKQVDFLEENTEYVLCFHPVDVLKTNGEIVDDFITNVPENYEHIETLARLGNYIHTPSVVYRNIIEEFPSEFKLTPIGDYFLYMLLAEKGKLKYFQEKMAVYRYGVGVISKMNDFKIAINNIRMYSCIMSSIKDFHIKNLLLNRQDEVLNIYKLSNEEIFRNVIMFPAFFYLKEILLNPKKSFRKIKNRIDKKIKSWCQ